MKCQRFFHSFSSHFWKENRGMHIKDVWGGVNNTSIIEQYFHGNHTISIGVWAKKVCLVGSTVLCVNWLLERGNDIINYILCWFFLIVKETINHCSELSLEGILWFRQKKLTCPQCQKQCLFQHSHLISSHNEKVITLTVTPTWWKHKDMGMHLRHFTMAKYIYICHSATQICQGF